MNSDYDEDKFIELIKKGKFNENNCFEWTGSFCGGYGVTTYSPIFKQKKSGKFTD